MKAYLVSKGIPENQITVSSISSQTLHGRTSDGGETSEITGYSLRQELSVRSTEVEKIGQIAREATELINQGILIESMAPEYINTELGSLKIEMLAEAAKDAKVRAEQIAQHVGAGDDAGRDGLQRGQRRREDRSPTWWQAHVLRP